MTKVANLLLTSLVVKLLVSSHGGINQAHASEANLSRFRVVDNKQTYPQLGLKYNKLSYPQVGLSMNTNQVAFESVYIGSKRIQDVVITNNGDRELNNIQFDLLVGTSGDLKISKSAVNGCDLSSMRLNPMESCNLSISYLPTTLHRLRFVEVLIRGTYLDNYLISHNYYTHFGFNYGSIDYPVMIDANARRLNLNVLADGKTFEQMNLEIRNYAADGFKIKLEEVVFSKPIAGLRLENDSCIIGQELLPDASCNFKVSYGPLNETNERQEDLHVIVHYSINGYPKSIASTSFNIQSFPEVLASYD